MTQKHALARVLEFVQRDFRNDRHKMAAARAAFVLLWLEDMNWHNEARALADRTLATPALSIALEKLEQDVMRNGELQDAVRLFNWIFSWKLGTDEWQATKGASLVEELWSLINTQT